MSAWPSRSSKVSPSSGSSAKPALAPTLTRTGVPSRFTSTGSETASMRRVESVCTVSALSCPGRNRANSSPPSRASRSSSRRRPRRRSVNTFSSASPTPWPCVSLTGLKRSRSSMTSAPVRRLRMWWSTSRWKAVRLSRPVSGSCRARCAISRSLARRSDRSRTAVTCRPSSNGCDMISTGSLVPSSRSNSLSCGSPGTA